MKLKRFLCILLGMMILPCMIASPAMAESQQTMVHYSVSATVIYRDYDGTQTTQQVEPGSLLKAPQPKGKPGCTFEGWRNAKTGELWNFTDPVTEHLILVASYIEETKTSGNSASGNNSGSSGVSGGSGSSNSASRDQNQATQDTQSETVAGETMSETMETVVARESSADESSRPALEKADIAETSSAEAISAFDENQGIDKTNQDFLKQMAWKERPLTETISVDQGTFSLQIKVETDGIGVSLKTSADEFFDLLSENGVITDEEISSLAQGESIDFVFLVEDAETEISEKSRLEIEQNAKDYTIGQYLDISLLKYFSKNGLAQEITETPEPLMISLQVPDYLINMNETIERNYQVLRNHEGTVETLDSDYQKDTHILTFWTDQFSDYAIAYRDSKKTEKNELPDKSSGQLQNQDAEHNTETISEHPISFVSYLLGIGFIVLLLFFIIIVLRREKKK